MQSPVHKEENPTKLSCSRYFKYLREHLKYNSPEPGRSIRTLATSLLLCCRCRLFCKSYLVKVSPFTLAPSTKVTVAVKLQTSSLAASLLIITAMQYSVSQGKTLPFLHILTQTVLGHTWQTQFSVYSAASINKSLPLLRNVIQIRQKQDKTQKNIKKLPRFIYKSLRQAFLNVYAILHRKKPLRTAWK